MAFALFIQTLQLLWILGKMRWNSPNSWWRHNMLKLMMTSWQGITFPHFWTLVGGNHRSPADSPQRKGRKCGADSPHKGTVIWGDIFTGCWPEQGADQTGPLPVIWDAMKLMWCNCNALVNRSILLPKNYAQGLRSVVLCCSQVPTYFSHILQSSWWRHQMEAFSALLAICAGNSPVPGKFLTQRPVKRSFDVFFDLRLIKRLSKQWWGWWFETLPRPLRRHSNGFTDNGVRLPYKQWRKPVKMHKETTGIFSELVI